MFSWFMPRETSFFTFFEQQAALVLRGAQGFLELVQPGSDIKAHSAAIAFAEQECDIVTNRCIEALHRTFLTPIDRDDIFRLVSRTDDIIDFIEAASERILLYRLHTMTLEIKPIIEVLVDIARELQIALGGLHDLSHVDAIKQSCIRIKHLENDADQLIHRAVGRLFDDEADIRLVIKWKEVYEKVQKSIGSCEDVAGIVEGVILEHM